MAGVVSLEDLTELDSGEKKPHYRNIKSITDIATKVGERQDGSNIYQAGPDAKDYKQGQIVPNDYAEKARKLRRNTNLVKEIMIKQNKGGTDRIGDTVSEEKARGLAREYKDKIDKADTEEERDNIRSEYFGS